MPLQATLIQLSTGFELDRVTLPKDPALTAPLLFLAFVAVRFQSTANGSRAGRIHQLLCKVRSACLGKHVIDCGRMSIAELLRVLRRKSDSVAKSGCSGQVGGQPLIVGKTGV